MLTAKLILERLDREGRVLERREQPSRSFVIGFISLLYLFHCRAGVSTLDITGTSRTPTFLQDFYDTSQQFQVSSPGGPGGVACSPGGNTTFWTLAEYLGIQVGTGNTTPTPTDYAMETRIAHGESAGELMYGGVEFYGLAFADPNGQFTIRRYFTNASGSPITVKEVGIYGGWAGGAEAYSWVPFCIARDVVAPGVAVANTEILRVTYVPQITV